MSDDLVRCFSTYSVMMAEDGDVKWVKYEDYKAAANRIEELEKHSAEAEGAAKTLDAANEYMTTQYGISALGNPIDRSRILAKIKGEQP